MAPVAITALGLLLGFLSEMLVPNDAPKFSAEWSERAMIVGITFPWVGMAVFGLIAQVIYLRCLRPFVGKVIERAAFNCRF